jgi:3-hydroxyisobutyrate dehydrogenase-like beta-hydroxyacid dehydrogenase
MTRTTLKNKSGNCEMKNENQTDNEHVCENRHEHLVTMTLHPNVNIAMDMVMNMNTAALAEGLGLADALGLNLDVVKQVFAQTGANSRVLQTDGDDMQQRDHAVYFSAAHAAKDSGIALALGKQVGLTLPLAQATLAQYQLLVSLGLGELDKSAVAELTFLDRHGA